MNGAVLNSDMVLPAQSIRASSNGESDLGQSEPSSMTIQTVFATRPVVSIANNIFEQTEQG